MRRNRSSEFPGMLFGPLTGDILDVIRGWGHTIALTAAPELKIEDITTLCVLPEHQETMKEAAKLAPQSLRFFRGDYIYTTLPGNYAGDPVAGFKLAMTTHTPATIFPDYATASASAPVSQAPMEVLIPLQNKVREWIKLCEGISGVLAAFNYISTARLTKPNVRFVFPGIVPLLKRVRNTNNPPREIKGKFATVPAEYREPIRKATEFCALMTVLEGNAKTDVSPVKVKLMPPFGWALPTWPEEHEGIKTTYNFLGGER